MTAAVPADVFVPIVDQLMEARKMDYSALERRCNIKESSIYAHLTRQTELDFDLCDLILCRLGAPMLWHVEPLKDIYQAIDFAEPKCANPRCDNRFIAKHRKQFCSPGCRPSLR